MIDDSAKSESNSQPILPRISMRWYFVAVAVLGLVITLISRSAFQRNLQIVLVLVTIAALVFLALSALSFAIAFSLGAVDKLISRSENKAQSPFAYDALPPQIIPPRSNE